MFFQLIYPISSCVLFCLVSWFISEKRRDIPYVMVARCFFFQVLLAVCFLKIPSVINALSVVNDGLQVINSATTKAVEVCFGKLAAPPEKLGLGFILATQGLPVIIVISALSYLLTYWKVLPFVIRILSFLFRSALGIGGTLGVGMATNIFTGVSETPLVMRAYLAKFSRNELFSLMVCGAAGTAGSVFIIYSQIVGPNLLPHVMNHIITAAVINIPSAVALSMIMVPPEKNARWSEAGDVDFSHGSSALDAISSGILDGAKVVAMVIIMIIGFVALIDVADRILLCIPVEKIPFLDNSPITLQRIMGWVIAPVTYILGVPWEDAHLAGGLIGTKMITNELVAFTKFAVDSAQMLEASKLIVLYSLCGFANFGTIGILIGVYGILLPERRGEVVKLGTRAVVAGMFSNCLCGSLVAALMYL